MVDRCSETLGGLAVIPAPERARDNSAGCGNDWKYPARVEIFKLVCRSILLGHCTYATGSVLLVAHAPQTGLLYLGDQRMESLKVPPKKYFGLHRLDTTAVPALSS